MSKLTSKEWIKLTELTVEYCHNNQRMGQAYMNALYTINSEVYREITTTNKDPFYNDDNLSKFMDFLNEEEYGN